MTAHLVPQAVEFVIDAMYAEDGVRRGRRRPLPAQPCHDFGTSVTGCTQFPESWTPDIADQRAQELATASEVGWSAIGDRRLSYREYPDGVWLMALHQEVDGHPRRLIGRFPWRYGGNVTATDISERGRYQRLFDGLTETLAHAGDSEVDRLCESAGYLFKTGWVAESLGWLVRVSAGYAIALPESTYLELYALSVIGLFETQTALDDLIARLWARYYPATWGLSPFAGRRFFGVDSVPSRGDLVRAVRRWLGSVLPADVVSDPETLVECGDIGLWGYHLDLTVLGRTAVFRAGPQLTFAPSSGDADEIRWEDDEGPEPWTMTLTATAHPCARLAAFVVELALCEVLGSGCDAIALPAGFRPGSDDESVLRRESSYLDLRRLVVVEE
ncbi:hypothetical protein HH308_24055 [Gordonia sp. TBRC 11910]|uniref:Uncharacterized protein n=1 Tax=Gordonia asplenii TaxID=2725283 RepID=A0A848L9P4_9ACTN|nr:hypothetical protein [Gordonia asplenii]NMO04298.1 hypothetical protein [Gordonia asplenii]